MDFVVDIWVGYDGESATEMCSPNYTVSVHGSNNAIEAAARALYQSKLCSEDVLVRARRLHSVVMG